MTETPGANLVTFWHIGASAILTQLVRRLAPCGSDPGMACPSRWYCHGAL